MSDPSAPAEPRKKDDWKEKAAQKKLEKQQMREKDQEAKDLGAKDSKADKKKQKKEKDKGAAGKPTETTQPKAQAKEALGSKFFQEQAPPQQRNPLFTLAQYSPEFSEEPLLLPRSLNSLGIVGQTSHARDFDTFISRVEAGYENISKFLADLFNEDDLLAVGTRHHVFKRINLPCPSVSLTPSSKRTSYLIQPSALAALLPRCTALLIGASVLCADGQVLTSRGTSFLVKYARSLGKQVVVVAQTYKLGQRGLKGREQLQTVWGKECWMVVTQAECCAGSGLGVLWEEYR